MFLVYIGRAACTASLFTVVAKSDWPARGPVLQGVPNLAKVTPLRCELPRRDGLSSSIKAIIPPAGKNGIIKPKACIAKNTESAVPPVKASSARGDRLREALKSSEMAHFRL